VGACTERVVVGGGRFAESWSGFAPEAANRVRYVAVGPDVERQASGHPRRETALDAFGECGEPRVRGWTAPAQSERKVAVGLAKLERADVIADRARQFVRIDPLGGDEWR